LTSYESPKDYANLSPDLVLDAVESIGYLSNARVLALNSYENRVYQIGLEEGDPIIAKFYRPLRWSNEQILEEHTFAAELAALEIPVIAPFERNGTTLFEYQGFRFALYRRRGGHAPELEDLDTLYNIGQFLGRIHKLGEVKTFQHRPTLSIETFGHNARAYILDNNVVPANLRDAYESLTTHVLEKVASIMNAVNYASIRLHGDCHPGNILVRDDALFVVDLDDARNGPAIQDLWMLLSGDRELQRSQLSSVIDGYEEFCDFDYAEFALIESMRALRMIHYTGWLAKRWTDPAFPQAFPWFSSERYWADHILALREQLAELDTPAISLQGL